MTAPRSAGRRPMAVWHYNFRYASDVAALSICLDKCPQGAPRGPKMSFRRHPRRGGERPLNKENHAVARVGLLSGKNCSVESPDRHRRDTQFAKKTKPKKMMQILIDMTARRSADRRPMAVWHYIFRYASDVAAWAVCLGDCPFETDGSRQTRHQNDEEAKNVLFFQYFM